MKSAPLDRGFPTDRTADRAELLQHLAVDIIDEFFAEAVDAWITSCVVALVAGARAGIELRGCRDQSNAAAVCGIGGRTRLGEMAAKAGMHNAGIVKIAQRVENTLGAVIVGMATAAGYQVHAQPFEMLKQVRLRSYIGTAALALCLRVIEIGMRIGFSNS